MDGDERVEVPLIAARTEVFPVGILLTSYLLLDWFAIAVRHEHGARGARAVGDMTGERQEAMIVVSSCAHALEGLHTELHQGLDRNVVAAARAAEPVRRRRGERVAAHVNVSLALGLAVDSGRWRGEIAHLFKVLRDPVVHTKAEATPPVPHPDPQLGNVSLESAKYSLESASAAVDLLCDVMAHLVEYPNASPAVGTLAPSITPRVEQLLAERRHLADG